LVTFKRPDGLQRLRDDHDGLAKPGTFDFLGFTLHWAKSPMLGKWVVKTRTAADRFRRALKRISQWCKANRHAPLERQRQVLNRSSGATTATTAASNRARCGNLRYQVVLAWWRWLRRRLQRGLSSEATSRLFQRYPLLWPATAPPA